MIHFITLRVCGNLPSGSQSDTLFPVLGLLLTIVLFILGQLAVRGFDAWKRIERLRYWENYAFSIIDDAILAIQSQAKYFSEFAESFQPDGGTLGFDPGLAALKSYFIIPENKLLEQLQRFRNGDELDKTQILSKIRKSFFGASKDLERAENALEKIYEEIIPLQTDSLIANSSLRRLIFSMNEGSTPIPIEPNVKSFAQDCLQALIKNLAANSGITKALSAKTLCVELRAICIKHLDENQTKNVGEDQTKNVIERVEDLEFKDDLLISLMANTKIQFSHFATNFLAYSSALSENANKWKVLIPSRIPWYTRLWQS